MAVEAKARLREVTADGKLVLHLHPGQWRAWEAKARIVCVLAGTQGGKSSFGPHWLHREIAEQAKRLEGEGLGGVRDCLAVSSTYDQFKLSMLPNLLAVFCDILKIGRYWEGAKVIELTEGLVPTDRGGKFWAGTSSDRMCMRVILRSADAEGGLEAATCFCAWCDEAGQPTFRLQAWEAIMRRLSIAQGRALITTTIYTGGWLKTEVYDRWKAGDKDYVVIQFDSTDNPTFSKEEFERARRTIAPAKFEMFYRGRFAKQAGLVYDCFDSAAQVIDPFPIPDTWLWHTGHDFGCVDEETEVLTNTGWKRQEDVDKGSIVLTLNPQTGRSEWQPVLRMNRYVAPPEMRLIEQRGHSSMTTTNHRWAVRSRGKGGTAFHTTDTTRVNDMIDCAAPCSTLPLEPVYRDSFVELIAWFWTEGQVNEGGVSLWQNEGEKAEKIRACLREEYGAPLTQTRNGRERAVAGWLERPRRQRAPHYGVACHFAINMNGAERILAVTEGKHGKTVRPSFITALTEKQLRLFIETSIKGDGWNRSGRGQKRAGWSINQREKERLDSFQMACSLAGIRTYLSEDKKSKHPRWLLSLYTRNRMQIGKAKQSPVHYEGVVWCPTTPNSTWLARRKGTVYFTGNSANPAALSYAQDPQTGLLYLAHEYLPGPRSIRDIVGDLKDYHGKHTVVRRVGGNHTSEQGIRDAYTAQGWPIMEPNERYVEPGIAKVYSFHKRGAVFVFRDCRLYLDEIASYSYKLGEDYSVTDAIEDKSSYHLMDCERALLSSFPDEIARRKRDAKTEAALAAIGRAF